MIKLIRRIPRPISQPLTPRPWPIQLPIRLAHRHRDSSIIQQVPHGRVAKPLGAVDPGSGLVADPGEDGGEEGVDLGGLPVVEEGGLEVPFLFFELGIFLLGLVISRDISREERKGGRGYQFAFREG